MSKFVLFLDMHSGGFCKFKPYEKIYVEADSTEEACQIFEEKTGRYPDSVSCECCGSDYSYHEPQELDQASGYHRNCRYDATLSKWVEERSGSSKLVTLDEYLARPDVLVIRKEEDASAKRFELMEL